MDLLLCNFSTGTGVARWPDLQFPHNYRIKLRLVIYIWLIALVIMKHPRWYCGHLCPLEALAWAARDRHSWPHAGVLLFLVLYLHLTSTGLFLEWSSWLRERKELWEAIPGSLVGLEFLLQALEFWFPLWPGTCLPLPQPTPYSLICLWCILPSPTQIRFLNCKSGGCTRSYLWPCELEKAMIHLPATPSLFLWVSWLTGRRKVGKRETGRVLHPPV